MDIPMDQCGKYEVWKLAKVFPISRVLLPPSNGTSKMGLVSTVCFLYRVCTSSSDSCCAKWNKILDCTWRMIEAIVCNRDAQHSRLNAQLEHHYWLESKSGQAERGEPKLGYRFLRNLGLSQYRIFEAVRISDYIVERERENDASLWIQWVLKFAPQLWFMLVIILTPLFLMPQMEEHL